MERIRQLTPVTIKSLDRKFPQLTPLTSAGRITAFIGGEVTQIIFQMRRQDAPFYIHSDTSDEVIARVVELLDPESRGVERQSLFELLQNLRDQMAEIEKQAESPEQP